jgi:hypothetical protein
MPLVPGIYDPLGFNMPGGVEPRKDIAPGAWLRWFSDPLYHSQLGDYLFRHIRPGTFASDLAGGAADLRRLELKENRRRAAAAAGFNAFTPVRPTLRENQREI